MANTWLQASEILGFKVHLSTPGGYEVDQSIAGIRSTESYQVFKDPHAACAGADLVTTDVWTSMGQEAEKAERLAAFRGYQINDALIAKARADVRIMHCLPAHRDEEITDSAVEHPRSIIFDQAENRMHAQKAILRLLMAPDAESVLAAARC